MAKPIYIIEHLEPTIGKWCLIEYENISNIVGKNNLWFTNIKRKNKKLEQFGRVFNQSVSELKLENACVLDPDSQKILKPVENFDYYIFGGILGDYPPKKRTKKELTKFLPGLEKRNIGKKQFPTDNAVKVTKLIADGKRFEDLNFKYKLTIPISKYSQVTLPFLYIIENSEPFINPRIVSYLKHKRGF